MIRIVLGLSLLVNIVLGYFLVTKKNKTQIIERLIIETHEKVNLEAPAQVHQDTSKSQPGGMAMLDSQDFQEAADKMESERAEFLTEKLELSEEKIIQHNRLREDFFKSTANFWNKGPMRELSFVERKQMLELEENLYKKLEKLHGKKKWARYQKFREDYNENGYKKQLEENEPFIFMGL